MHHMSTTSVAVNDQSFDAQMGRAMAQMERDMSGPSSGDYDRDFAAMMIPHHQGAIDMARIQLQFGKDPVLRRLAQAIIVEQLQEIEVMKRQLTTIPVASSQPSLAPVHIDQNKE
ncbi:MAG: DUF305 domain-containing protein [Hyphomicrobiales bacterium]|nr:DUF305 domain-containing protein [Hyphomicrobiales bacterium]